MALNKLLKDLSDGVNDKLEIWNLVRSKSPRVVGVANVEPVRYGLRDGLEVFHLNISYLVDGNSLDSSRDICTLTFHLMPVPSKLCL